MTSEQLEKIKKDLTVLTDEAEGTQSISLDLINICDPDNDSTVKKPDKSPEEIMDDIANKLTGTVTNQLQELSSTNSSQIELLSQNIAKQNNELVKAMGIQNEKLLSYIMNNGKANEDLHDRRVENMKQIKNIVSNEITKYLSTSNITIKDYLNNSSTWFRFS